MRLVAVLFVFVLLALFAAPAAQAVVFPVNEYEGGTPWSCRWNPYAHWDGTWWTPEWQWYDLMGNPLGIRCA